MEVSPPRYGGSRPVHPFMLRCHCTDRKITMAAFSELPSAESVLDAAPLPSRSARPFAVRLWSIANWIGDYVETMANYYAAAATYEQLSRLSDAELRRRGLSRESLARDVLA